MSLLDYSDHGQNLTSAGAASGARAASRWTVELCKRPDDVATEWRALERAGGTTVFQKKPVMQALFDTLTDKGGPAPLIALVRDKASGQPAAIFPMTQEKRGPVRRLVSADCGVLDYTMPLYDPALVTAQNVDGLVAELAGHLPGDVFYLNKLPARTMAGANPFASLAHAGRLPLSCWFLPLGKTYETEIRPLQSKSYRKNNRRRTRQLEENHARRFDIWVGDEIGPEQMDRFFALHESYREARGRSAPGASHAWRIFYERIVANPQPGAEAFIAALSADDEVIAMDFGLLDEHGPTPVLTGMAGEEWATYAPGLQLMEECFAWFGARGYPRCDLSIGDYAYKSAFRAEEIALFDVMVPVSPAGRLLTALWRLKTRLRHSPRLRKLLGKA